MIYVAFGTLVKLQPQQIEAIAGALIANKQSFNVVVA